VKTERLWHTHDIDWTLSPWKTLLVWLWLPLAFPAGVACATMAPTMAPTLRCGSVVAVGACLLIVV